MRIEQHVAMLAVADTLSCRSTCARREVGCVLTDVNGKIIGTGYNGVATGQPHCNEGNECAGASAPSGTNLDACEAIHAEQNALLQCSNVMEIFTAYCTASPCITCTKLLLNTRCREIRFMEEYPHMEARDLWKRSGRVWIQVAR